MRIGRGYSLRRDVVSRMQVRSPIWASAAQERKTIVAKHAEDDGETLTLVGSSTAKGACGVQRARRAAARTEHFSLAFGVLRDPRDPGNKNPVQKVRSLFDSSSNKSINTDTMEQAAPGTGSPLTRTLSVENIAPKLSNLFRKRKRTESPLSIHGSPGDSGNENEDESAKRRKKQIESQEREKFLQREKELDEELPESLRKFRPRGFKFNLPPTDRPIRIYADGVFDLFHLGHMRQLEQAKKSFENVELVCGIPSDKETQKKKGLTVLSDKHRIETLKHCKWVDEVIENAPWCVTADFLIKHRLDYVAHDDLPYASAGSDDIYKPIKERGMFLTTQRTEGISTSDIITKIIRDYDKYLMRNFARGATRKELNVSWFKKNELEFKKHINDFRTYWTKNRNNFNNVSKDLYVEVREYLRGNKADNPSHSSNSSLSLVNEESQSRSSSPVTDFASKYIVNKNEKPIRSIVSNLKDWIGMDDSHDEDSTSEEPKTLTRSQTKGSASTTNADGLDLNSTKSGGKANRVILTPKTAKKPRKKKEY